MFVTETKSYVYFERKLTPMREQSFCLNATGGRQKPLRHLLQTLGELHGN
jgi:hypothetical protein